jgi:hypothetical protein
VRISPGSSPWSKPGPGRPKGGRSRLSAALDTIAAADAEAVLASVLAAAKAGDVAAAKVVLDRLWPIPKSRAIEVPLPPIEDATGLVGAMSQVVSALADGTLTPDEARLVASVLGELRMAIETEELSQRVEALEAALALSDEEGGR